jgi:hypothetical protein
VIFYAIIQQAVNGPDDAASRTTLRPGRRCVQDDAMALGP